MLSKVNRLKGKQKFDMVFKRGEKFYSPYFVMYRLSTNPEQQSQPRVGIVASKKVGGAVIRNHARRLISEALRTNLARLKPNCIYVFIALKTIANASSDEVNTTIIKLNP